MSELTEETRNKAEELRVPTDIEHNLTHSLSSWNGGPGAIQRLIDFLEENKNLKEAVIWLSGSYDDGDHDLTIGYKIPLDEEVVLRAIRRRENEMNIRKKEVAKAALSKEERLALEIKTLEKNLARKKKALGK